MEKLRRKCNKMSSEVCKTHIREFIRQLQHNEDFILDLGDIHKINSPVLRKAFRGSDIYRAGVHTEGTCFFHSVMYLMEAGYRSATEREQKEWGQTYRKHLATSLSHKTKVAGKLVRVYDQLLYSEFGITITDLQGILNDVEEWVSEEVWQLIAFTSKRNIFILRDDDIYCGFGQNNSDQNSLIIINIRDCHYEPVFQVDSDGSFITEFPPDSDIVKQMKKLYKSNCNPSI